MAVTLYSVKWPLDGCKDRLLTASELLVFAHQKTVGGFPETVELAMHRVMAAGYEVSVRDGSGLR